MTKIKILHLTDFHYSKDKKSIPIQNRLVDSMCKSLEKEKGKIDYIFFTGDLVNRGDSIDDFYEAEFILLEKLSKELEIVKSNIIICAGNHDVNRGQELEDIQESIKKIKNNKELDNYTLKQDGKSFAASLENFNNYFEFQEKFYESHKIKKDIIKEMYSIHFRQSKGKNICITTINSAWRAIDSDTDSGNLLYPPHLLKEAFEIIKDEKAINIFLMHHPLSDFKYWNSQTLENIIFKDYHVMFSGHTHKNRDTIHIVPEIGMYSCSSHATLSQDGESKIGYSIVEIDLEEYSLKIENKIYDLDENLFYSSDPKIAQIPVSQKKKAENDFRKTIRKKFNQELEKANDLFLSNSDKRNDANFIKMFTEPIIKEKTKTLEDNNKPSKSVFLNKLLFSKENEILFGKDKSGKTAILMKMLLDSLNEFSTIGVLPIYIDCKDYEKSGKPIDFVKILSSFYEMNRSDAENLSNQFHIKILIDNFKEHDELIIQSLNSFVANNANSSITAATAETLFNSFSNQSINGVRFNHKFIWEIGRTEIRLLTNKWPNLTESNREVLLEKIHKVFKQLNIPSNYWTVSLFIWIFEKNSDANFRNNFQLIELYIDNLLDKDNFVFNESIHKIDYEDFKSFLSELAYYLMTEKESSNYVLSHVELIVFSEKYKNNNRKFVIEVSEITDLIISKGVLKKLEGDSYTFRLNGVFEYFLAFYMKDNHSFRNKVIDDGHFYLSFGNEFEICAGFDSRDRTFIDKIYEKTKFIFAPVTSKYDIQNIDNQFQYKIQNNLKVDLRLPKILKNTVKTISLENQDVIYDEVFADNDKISEVQKKKYYQEIESNSENLEKSLLILSRVFRNSKFKDLEFEDEVFDFILNSTCVLGFQLMDDIEENKLDFIDENTSENDLMRILTTFIPIVIQTFFFDAVVQNNLEVILIDKINLLKKDMKNNQLKLLVLYFSLIDLNLKQNHKYIDEIINLLSIGVLKQTSLIKLYIYLATKVSENRSLEDKIKRNIKAQELSIDNTKNIGSIEKDLSNITKSNLINKNRKP